jgi:ATP-dependent DNA helicase RecG
MTALRGIHFPQTYSELANAKKRLIFDKLFLYALGLRVNAKRQKKPGAPVCQERDISRLLKQLPFSLTNAQSRAIREISSDMAQNIPMSRILVGDVGCGKTVCAAAAIYTAIKAGKQAALMVPTEILARQHYEDLAPLFAALGIRVELLLGATTEKEKRRIRAACAGEGSERADLVIGTHALLSDKVQFADLGLTVTDEQHRFGVRQRATLKEKEQSSHLLVMSATPIPRTLALSLYGDLDISRIDEMPRGRQRVDTYVVGESYRERLLGFIRRQVAQRMNLRATPEFTFVEDASIAHGAHIASLLNSITITPAEESEDDNA